MTAGAGEIAFAGNQGGAAVCLRSGRSFASFWGFPWEALPTVDSRNATLGALFDACAEAADALFVDDFEDGGTAAWSAVVP